MRSRTSTPQGGSSPFSDDNDEWAVECPRCGMVLAECVCPREDADSALLERASGKRPERLSS